MPLMGLASGTLYHYAILSTNASGGNTQSPDYTFTTTGRPVHNAGRREADDKLGV